MCAAVANIVEASDAATFIYCAALLQVFLTPTHLAIAMEYAQGGDMFKYICRHKPHCRLLESQARWIFQQLIIGLDYCHNKVHRPPILDKTRC